MNSQTERCLKHRRYPTEDAAWCSARKTKNRLISDFRAWKCGGHWHIGKSRRSIAVVFDFIESERKARRKAS